MRISKLSIENFRSFKKLELDFGKANMYVLLGPNGAGKTNILEAVSVLSRTRSFLGAKEADTVRWGEEYYRVKAMVSDDSGAGSAIEVVTQIAPVRRKACFINGVKKSLGEAVGHLPTVSFLPQDLELFSGSPQVRRDFLDVLLCQVSPEYSLSLSRYSKILKQRNSLLKKIADGEASRRDLDQWDGMLAEEGSVLVQKRLELIEVFECTLLQELRALGEPWGDARMVYMRKGEARTNDELKKEFLELLDHYQERDIDLKSTTVGPHRDDWILEADGRGLTTFASRGEQRAAVLALIFLEVSFLEIRRGERPVVLLDDVFSELDEEHQNALLKCFDDYQVMITATHVPDGAEGAEVIRTSDVGLRTSDFGLRTQDVCLQAG